MEEFFYFFVSGVKAPLGYVHRTAVEGMLWTPDVWNIDYKTRVLTLSGTQDQIGDCTEKLRATLRQNFEQGRVVRKWHNENLPVYTHGGQHVLDLDLCGVDLFGVVSYGVHLTGFVVSKNDDGSPEYRYWVPRRSFKKATFPGILDNFVAGNILSDETPLNAIVREVYEETGISTDFTRTHIRSCGTVTYQMSTLNDGRPGCQHHCQFVFELELPANMIPTPNDGEVECFSLMSLLEVQEALISHEFTPNRTLTYLAHFVRRGFVNSENEAEIIEVCSRLHRKHDLFVV